LKPFFVVDRCADGEGAAATLQRAFTRRR
jgi:hypothetical protein